MDQITLTLTQGSEAQPSQAAAPEGSRRVSAADLIAATPWAIEHSMLETIRSIALRENESVEALEAKAGRPLQNTRSVSVRGDVAVVPITGPVFRYANLFTQISGATSMQELATDFNAALSDPAIKSIVLSIDSPGGQVTGIAEFADMVRGASKPVVAYVDGMAASAAYWIASAASRVVMAKNAMAGNIGAVLTIDTRKTAGVEEIVSSQSPNKRPDASTDQGRAQIQTMVDAHAQVFIDDVASFRGTTADNVINAWGGGAMFIAADAVRLGLADATGTLETLIAELAGGKQHAPAIPKHSGHTAPGAHTMNLEELRAAHPELCAALVAEGHAAGLIAGAASERQRIIDVEAQLIPGHEALIAQYKADGKTTGPEAAVAILAAERAVCANRADALRTSAQAPVHHAAAPATEKPGIDPSLPIEERAQAEWDASEKLRGEFGAFGTYLAYLKASEAGFVRVLTKSAAQ